MTFDKRQTNIAKGIAVLMLLWHHLFYNDPERYDRFVSMFYIGDIPLEAYLSMFCKVCVAVFLVLSGYGLYKSYIKYQSVQSHDGRLPVKKQFLFVKNHLLKLMFGFWFIYIIFVFMGLFFGRKFYGVYDLNPIYCLIDFCGLARLFGTPTFNATWWFMSLIIVFYIIFPLLVKIMRYSPELLVLIASLILFLPFVPSMREIKYYFLPFVLGMYISQINGFGRINLKLDTKVKSICVSVLMVVLTAGIRHYWFNDRNIFDSLFAVSIIVASFCVISKIPVLNTVLFELGKYSASIFMFHTFIFSYYFKDLIYGVKYPILIFLLLTVVCYIIARLLELLKQVVRYDKLVDFCLKTAK